MFDLARLTLQQRSRKLALQNRWPVIATVGGLLLLFALRIGYIAPRVAALLTHDQVTRLIASLWIGWALLGTLSGKDLTAHLPVQRLTILPVSFRKLYALDLLLAWLSAPMLAVIAGAITAAIRLHANVAVVIASTIVFAYTVRLVVSIARSALMSDAFAMSLRVAVTASLISGVAIVLYTRIFSALLVVALIAIDYPIQRRVLLSGSAGLRPLRTGTSAWLRLSTKPSTTLWLLTLVSWLRHRNTLLLLLWGTSYGFLYTYFTRPQEQSYFLLFTWMVLIFHSYLRGNVLGLDHRAAWAYFLWPRAASRIVALKHASLTLLQAIMVVAVLAPALIHPSRGMSTALQWTVVISFALTAIALGELAGTFFSILHAEPIERGSMYSGGTTVGAFVIPVLQFALLLFYGGVILTLRNETRPLWVFAIVAPVLLWSARVLAGRAWMRLTLRKEQEELLLKLSSVSV